MTWLDWLFVFLFFAMTLAVGLAVARRSGKSDSEYFLGGRSMPWWLLGASMVATTFSTDTPNLVTDLVRSNGVAGNWIWWSSLVSGMIGVFIFSKLWRRTGAVTDLEVYEMRYSGKGAALLRGYRALYVGVLSNIITMSAVTLAAMKIGGVMLGLTPFQSVFLAMLVTVIFSSVGGFRGVIYTDLVLFVIGMVGAVIAAYFALKMPEIGGLGNLIGQLRAQPELVQKLGITPAAIPRDSLLLIFIVPFFLLWWCGDQGGGYIVQRLLAAKSEKDAMGAVLFFNLLNYVLRPWPWIIVALASLLIFPVDPVAEQRAAKEQLQLIQQRQPAALAELPLSKPEREARIRELTAISRGAGALSRDFKPEQVPDNKLGQDLAYSAMLVRLPPGWFGFVLVSLIAAYISTISTHLNWGSSYIVNDFYHRFLRSQASGRELVWVGRLSTVLLMVLSTLLAFCLQSAMAALTFFMTLGAGIGVIMLLRWFWWRINAWSELTVIIAAMPVSLYFQHLHNRLFPAWELEFHDSLILSIVVTNLLGFAVLAVTPATDPETLLEFYLKIRPGGPGWRRIAGLAEARGIRVNADAVARMLPLGLLCVVLGGITIYSALFCIGNFLFGNFWTGGCLLAAAVAGAICLFRLWPRLNRY